MKIRVKHESRALIIAFVFLAAVIYAYWYFVISPILNNISYANNVSQFVLRLMKLYCIVVLQQRTIVKIRY